MKTKERQVLTDADAAAHGHASWAGALVVISRLLEERAELRELLNFREQIATRCTCMTPAPGLHDVACPLYN